MPSTVRTHLATIYRDLGVSSKMELRDKLLPAATTLAEPPIERPIRPEKPSIEVLAFEYMSGEPEQEYFSDGISDDIITSLSPSPWLFDIARNTTFTYKSGSVDFRRVAEDLGVRFVLEGSVRRSGDRVGVTAQLNDGTTGGYVWSERYDGRLEDVFEPQDEIARNLVASIQTTVHLSTIQEPFEGAVALNPNCPLAYGSLGTLLGILSRSEEAIVNQEIAIRFNPLDPSIFFRFFGSCFRALHG